MLPNSASSRHGNAWKSALLSNIARGALLLGLFGCSSGYEVPTPESNTVPVLYDGDAKCLGNSPSQGDFCTKDCIATCASTLGKRVCTCEGGVFVQCACYPPEGWPYEDVPVAPYCDRITGLPRYLQGEACPVAGQHCASKDVAGQGCVCETANWSCGALVDKGIAESAPDCAKFGSGQHAAMVSSDERSACDNVWELCISREYNPTGTSPRGCVCLMRNGRLEWLCGSANRWFRAP